MKKRVAAILGGCAVVTLVSCFPLSWAAGMVLPENIEPRLAFSGTIWKGNISGIPQIGPIHTRLSFAKLISGQRPLSFQSSAPYLDFSGKAGLTGQGSLKVDGRIRGMGSIDRRFSGLDGTYTLNLTDIVLDGVCHSALGTFSTNVLQANQRAWQWQGPEMSGPVACEDGDILLSLSGKDTLQDIRARIRIAVGGAYKAEVDVTTGDSRADLVLPLFGFQKTGRDYRLLEAGRWY